MGSKLKNDASSQIRGYIYQFCVALDCCFSLTEGETLYIEKFGDITVGDNFQIEVKQYIDDLTDAHENIWKSIKNWIAPEFSVSSYSKLTLLTTQNISKESKFYSWHDKSTDAKISDMKGIRKSVNAAYIKRVEDPKNKDLKIGKSEVHKIMDHVLDPSNETRLKDILDRFIITSSYPRDEVLYNRLCQRDGIHLAYANRQPFIDSLLGKIISPINTKEDWNIGYAEFQESVANLTTLFATAQIAFPEMEITTEINVLEHESQVYVEKIREIEYREVLHDAISEYVFARNIITEELRYDIQCNNLKKYEAEVLSSFKPSYRLAGLEEYVDRIRQSKIFYNRMMLMQPPKFEGYSSTPIKFKNGILHGLMNTSELKWLV